MTICTAIAAIPLQSRVMVLISQHSFWELQHCYAWRTHQDSCPSWLSHQLAKTNLSNNSKHDKTNKVWMGGAPYSGVWTNIWDRVHGPSLRDPGPGIPGPGVPCSLLFVQVLNPPSFPPLASSQLETGKSPNQRCRSQFGTC